MSSEEFTVEDIEACWKEWHKEYLCELLNEVYPVEEAQENLRSLIGSKYDKRTQKENEDE